MPTTTSAQYIDEDKKLRWFTDADHVLKSKPRWIGPHDWFWLPPAPNGESYDVIVKDIGFENWSEVESAYASMDQYTCLILDDRVPNPEGVVHSYWCKPEIVNQKYQFQRLSEEVGDPGYFPSRDVSPNSFGNFDGDFGWNQETKGWGKVVFTWNWRRHRVHSKLCERGSDPATVDQEDIITDSSLPGVSQEQIISSARITADDIPTEVNICSDDPTELQPNKPQPYDTWSEMQSATYKCQLQVMEDYDGGHETGEDYWHWRESVPEGWFRGQNEGFNRAEFMDWCIRGGDNPFSPKPFPGISKDEFDTRAVYDGGKSHDEYGDIGAERVWEKTASFAGSLSDGLFTQPGGRYAAGQDSLFHKAEQTCQTLYSEVIDRRRSAFMELCKKEPYSHFNGCSQRLKECRGYQRDDGTQVGVNQCCTDTHPEYHYHQVKSFQVPCKPVDAFRWTGGAFVRDDWEDGRGSDASAGGYTGVVEQISDRGFVGSNAWLAPLGGDGEPMTVQSDSVKIGTYFWFDLLSGTVGIKSFDERSYSQEVKLPASHKKAKRTDYWKWGHGIKGTGSLALTCGDAFFLPDCIEPISAQRDPDRQRGWIYNLYFCERKFSDEELKLLQSKWNSLPAQLKQQKNEVCPDGEVYQWDPNGSSEGNPGEWRCMTGTPVTTYCATCVGHEPSPACPVDNYNHWQAMPVSMAQSQTPNYICKEQNTPPPYRAWPEPNNSNPTDPTIPTDPCSDPNAIDCPEEEAGTE